MAKKRRTDETIAEQKIKNSLDDILEEIESSGEYTISKDKKKKMSNGLPMLEEEIPIDYNEVIKNSHERAVILINTLVEYHIAEKYRKEQYIQEKIKIDIMSISKMLIEMETSEKVIQVLIQQITTGNNHPKMFEVLSKLQTSNLDIVSRFKQLEIVIENSYKTISLEYEQRYEDITQKPDEIEEGTSKSIKGMLQGIQENRELINEENQTGKK